MTYYVGSVPISSDLYHHGIAGMKWGQRNGPPYPLDQKDKSAAEKRAEKGSRKSSEKETIKVKSSSGKVTVSRKVTKRESREERKRVRDKVKYDRAIERGKQHTIAGSIAGGVLKNLLVSELAKQSAVVFGMATMNPMLSTVGAYTLAAPMIAANTIHAGKNIVDRMLYLKSIKD